MVRSGKLELGQRHQGVRLLGFLAEIIEQRQRTLSVTERVGEVALHEQEKGKVVLADREHPLVAQRLVDRQGPMRVAGRLGELPELLVVEAEIAVDHRKLPEILD